MKPEFWFSADFQDCRFICVRIVINKQTEFFFHQMGSMTNIMHKVHIWPLLRPGSRWELRTLPRPPSQMGRA